MHYRQLGRTGLNVSVLSFGTSSLGGVFHPTDDAESVRAVHVALDLGINFLDTSPYYGATRSEAVLGRALKGIRRDRYILATKVGQYREGDFDFSAARVVRSLDESCARLGVDYVDLLQCHDIEFADLSQIVHETLPALVRLREAGRIGHIGVTGLPLKVLQAALDQTEPGVVETVLSFCRYGLHDTALDSHAGRFHERQAGIITASPTGMGLFTERGVPAWHPAPPALLAGARRAVDYCRSVGADATKLAFQFCLAHPGFATVLFSSADPAMVRKSIGYLNEPIDFELMGKVLGILRPIRNHNFTRGRAENRDTIIA
jgi:L-galactose dehydrogenase